MSQLLPSLAELDQHAEAQPAFAAWRAGYGPFEHAPQTQAAVFRLAHQGGQASLQPGVDGVYRLRSAVGRLGSAGLGLVVHRPSARRGRVEGGRLEAEDFEETPEGHTGGDLNMV